LERSVERGEIRRLRKERERLKRKSANKEKKKIEGEYRY
jgi:hypothetical protein